MDDGERVSRAHPRMADMDGKHGPIPAGFVPFESREAIAAGDFVVSFFEERFYPLRAILEAFHGSRTEGK